MSETTSSLLENPRLIKWHKEATDKYHSEKPQTCKKNKTSAMHYIGPAFLIAMACLDPGNLSGDIAVGQKTGYRLLWLLVVSSLLCYFYQYLALTLGTYSGKDISQLCRIHYSSNWSITLWLMTEIALLASDTQEVLGTAIALNILIGIDIFYGVLLSLVLVFIMLFAQNKGQQFFEKIFAFFISIMGICFFCNFFYMEKSWSGIAMGFIPKMHSNDWSYAISLVGAILMPQNLFLHSTLVNTRKINKQNE
jgi:NRAMP (natural resistance-associated macrophage protein)-like metal ion transporter